MNSLPPLPASFVIDPLKISAYLLNIHHRQGRSKAQFFCAWGFDPARPDEFALAALAHPEPSRLTRITPTGYGHHFVFEGPMTSPKGPTPTVRSVWEVVPGGTTGKLVTAHRLSP